MNLKVFDMDLDAILADSIQKHPDGGKTLGDELRNLKHNLNINEGFTCNICNKVIQHMSMSYSELIHYNDMKGDI